MNPNPHNLSDKDFLDELVAKEGIQARGFTEVECVTCAGNGHVVYNSQSKTNKPLNQVDVNAFTQHDNVMKCFQCCGVGHFWEKKLVAQTEKAG